MQFACKWVLCLAVLTGCSTPESPETTPFLGCEHPSSPGFAVGTGEKAFTEISGDTEIPYVAGFQGGYHIWGSVRVSEEVARDGELAFNVCQDGIYIARVAFFAELKDTDDEMTLGYTGATVVLLHDLRPDVVAGKPSILAARYIDADGVTFTDTATFVPRCCTSITGEVPSTVP